MFKIRHEENNISTGARVSINFKNSNPENNCLIMADALLQHNVKYVKVINEYLEKNSYGAFNISGKSYIKNLCFRASEIKTNTIVLFIELDGKVLHIAT